MLRSTWNSIQKRSVQIVGCKSDKTYFHSFSTVEWASSFVELASAQGPRIVMHRKYCDAPEVLWCTGSIVMHRKYCDAQEVLWCTGRWNGELFEVCFLMDAKLRHGLLKSAAFVGRPSTNFTNTSQYFLCIEERTIPLHRQFNAPHRSCIWSYRF